MIKKKLFFETIKSAITIMTLAALVIFGIKPQWRNLQKVLSEKKSLTLEITQTKDYLTFLEQQEKQPNLDRDYKRALTYLPENANQSNLILQWSAIGSLANVTVTSLSIGDPKSDQIEINAELRGGYSAITDFFAKLQTALRANKIESLALKSADNQTVLATLKGEAFFKNLPKTFSAQKRFSPNTKLLNQLIEFGEPVTPTEVPGGSSDPFGNL